jgi:tungstate transport system ATP-binding protein
MNDAYRLQRVAFRYGSGAPAFETDDLAIPAAAITALVGPNGAGKTTLLNLLAFLSAPESGRVRFFGGEVADRQYPDLRRRVGYVHQKPYLFRASVRKNLEYGLRWRGMAPAERARRIGAALEELELQELAERPAHALSGGEAQKVALARALVLEPEVLILDEPFSHVDREFRRDLETLLRQIRTRSGKTVVFSTHDYLQAHALADVICSLADGRVLPVFTVNLFSGRLDGTEFDTGRVRIHVPEHSPPATRLAIDSNQIVLSAGELDSSMRNRFCGTIRALADHDGQVQATVEAGELFQVLITRSALSDLGLNVGGRAWVSFKSTAVHLF